ncbi:hypothetical protein ON058_04670 [Demequina sp. B12]|uniref:hypothetical protein n=1 Tax=Demequina sp. B12 TaxID=2992757 RepID=UPI00237C34D8|nr:hypothetical protein [Demequina sp. B12]MDE0572707.1 hypothetical protein [Demequina sp. B12]
MSVPQDAPREDCFFISPIGDDESPERKNSDLVMNHILTPALVPAHVTDVRRADGDANPGEVTPAIVKAILDAKLVVADLTGANPNVYYELAIAHAFRKPTIHIAKPGELPRFDIKDSRVIRYGVVVDEAAKAVAAIDKAARYALDHPESAETPVSRTADLVSLRQSDNPAAEQIEYLTQTVAHLDARIDRALNRSGDETLKRLQRSLGLVESDDLAAWARRLRSFVISVVRHPSSVEKDPSDLEALMGLVPVLVEVEQELEQGAPDTKAVRNATETLESIYHDLTAIMPGASIPQMPAM